MPSRWRGPVSSRFCGPRRGETCGRRHMRPGSSAAMAVAQPARRPASPSRKLRARHDVPVWPADVRVWEVSGPQAKFQGLFFGDYFARSSKRSGAWMTVLRSQHKLDGEVRPLVINVMNFAKAGDGEPTLLSFDDARTRFHEFGHGLHGLMSDVTSPMIACTRGAPAFVEFPSQF